MTWAALCLLASLALAGEPRIASLYLDQLAAQIARHAEN